MKLVIADDDRQIREGIKEGIDWKSLEIDEVFIAANGIEAFELFKKHIPEIVITDIKMPGMDGLLLFTKIKEVKPDAKVIIISGYSDFEYLKKAIQYGAVDYELKPIKVRSLITLIKKVKEDILKEKVSKEKFQIHLQAYKENFINNLLLGNITDHNIILEGFQQYLGFEGKSALFSIIIAFDQYLQCTEVKTKEEVERAYDLLYDFFHANLLNENNGLFYKLEENKFLIIMKTQSSVLFHNNLIFNLNTYLTKLNDYSKKETGLTVSAGISKTGNMFNIHELYKQAKQSLEFKFYRGIGSINLYSETLAMEKTYIASEANEEDLKEEIENFNFNICENIIKAQFNYIKSNSYYSKSSILNFSMNLIIMLKKITKQDDIGLEGFINSSINSLEEETSFEIVEECRDYVLKVYEKVFRLYKDMKSIRGNTVISKAIIYIKNNYYKELTAEVLADYIGKTPNYFSHIFKKEVGISFSKYVNKVRIDKAKELIVNSDLFISEIAQKVGYKDYIYFTQVFKKIEGYTPTDLRMGKK